MEFGRSIYCKKFYLYYQKYYHPRFWGVKNGILELEYNTGCSFFTVEGRREIIFRGKI